METLTSYTSSMTTTMTSSVTSVGGQVTNVTTSAVGSVQGMAGDLTKSLADATKSIEVLSGETKAKILLLGPFQLLKVGRIIKTMQESEHSFSDSDIDIACRSIYVTQSDADLTKAYEMFATKLHDRTDFIPGEDFREMLPLLGENMPEDQIDALFEQVDADGSGAIEYDEFKTLVLAMNPKDGKSQIPGFDSFKGGIGAVGDQVSAVPGASHVMGASTAAVDQIKGGFGFFTDQLNALPGAGHVTAGFGHVTNAAGAVTDVAGGAVSGALNVTGQVAGSAVGVVGSVASAAQVNAILATTLEANTMSGLAGANPLQMTKIGRICQQLKASVDTTGARRFTDADINLVIKTLYVKKEEKFYKQTFDLFDVKLSGKPNPQGYLTAEEFKDLLPDLGEEIPADKVDELFLAVDADGSGQIELDEFITLCQAIVDHDAGGGGVLGGMISKIEIPVTIPEGMMPPVPGM